METSISNGKRDNTMNKKQLHRTIIQVEVLSDGYFDFSNLAQLSHDSMYGDISSVSEVKETSILQGDEAVAAVVAQGSDPEFFGMDDEGNDLGYGQGE